jgi:hypothetical protein
MLLLDHPDRLLSATVLTTSALATVPRAGAPGSNLELPGPDRRLLVTIPGMGHALSPPILAPLAAAILDHTTTAADRTG